MLFAELIDVAERWAVPIGVIIGILLIVLTGAGRKAFSKGHAQGKRLRDRLSGKSDEEDPAMLAGASGGLPENVLDRIEAVRKTSSWLRRVFEITTPVGTFQVEFNARRTASDSFPILVDGQTQILPVTRSEHGRRYQFRCRGVAGFIDVRTTPWMTLRSLKLWIGNRLLYSEG